LFSFTAPFIAAVIILYHENARRSSETYFSAIGRVANHGQSVLCYLLVPLALLGRKELAVAAKTDRPATVGLRNFAATKTLLSATIGSHRAVLFTSFSPDRHFRLWLTVVVV
jgi:hypothetical protein